MKTRLTCALAALLPLPALADTPAAPPADAPSIGMPAAHPGPRLEDTRGCITVTVFKDVELMGGTERELFLREYSPGTLCTCTEGEQEVCFTAAQTAELTAYLKARRKALLADGVDESDIRFYLRVDSEAGWPSASTVLQCASEAGFTNLLFSAMPPVPAGRGSISLRELVQTHVLGGEPLAKFPEDESHVILEVDDPDMDYATFAEALSLLVGKGASPALAYGGKVHELHIAEALLRALTPGQRLLQVRLREGSPEEWDAFELALAAPDLPTVDISFIIAPKVKVATLMEYIALADANPRVTGYVFSRGK